MPQTTNQTRLGVIETQMQQNIREHGQILEHLEKLECKLDYAIANKLDKQQYETFVNRVWAVGLLVISGMIGIVVWLLQGGHR